MTLGLALVLAWPIHFVVWFISFVSFVYVRLCDFAFKHLISCLKLVEQRSASFDQAPSLANRQRAAPAIEHISLCLFSCLCCCFVIHYCYVCFRQSSTFGKSFQGCGPRPVKSEAPLILQGCVARRASHLERCAWCAGLHSFLVMCLLLYVIFWCAGLHVLFAVLCAVCRCMPRCTLCRAGSCRSDP